MHIAYSEFCSLAADKWISQSKPAKVFHECFSGTDTLICCEPVTADDIKLAHDPIWVDEVLSLRADNGFGARTYEELRQVLWANGAFVAAAEACLTNKIAFAPVSGFHHAGYHFNGGFCTFNGLIIALQKLQKADKVTTALILDFDGHHGDGTQNIIDLLDLQWIEHLTRHQPFEKAASAVAKAVEAIERRPDIVVYQAGADSHINDSFGAGYFSDKEWKQRDKIIFECCRQLKIPIVWNLAGGYSGAETIELHRSTYQTAKAVFEPTHLSSSQSLLAVQD